MITEYRLRKEVSIFLAHHPNAGGSCRTTNVLTWTPEAESGQQAIQQACNA